MLYFVKSYRSYRKYYFSKGKWISLWWYPDSTFHTWLQLSSSVCLSSFPTKYRSYLLKLISIFGHFLTINNGEWPPRSCGRCYVNQITLLCTFLEFFTNREANSARSFQNAFCNCSRALNIILKKTSYFWWMSSFFSLSSPLNFIRHEKW